MATTEIRREIASDGTVTLRDERAAFVFRRFPGVMEILIEGVDRGQFGEAPLDEVAMALLKDRPLELFIDATGASMPTVEVSRQWTRFFSLNQQDLTRVSILVGSKSVELTVAIAQHLSRTGRLMQIYSDPELYEARKAQALQR